LAVCACPHCRTGISSPEAAARSNDILCPKCGTRLEVASGSRTISTLTGLAAGVVAWKLSSNAQGDLGAVLPTFYAFLAFGIVSALVMTFTASLRNAPLLPAPLLAHGGDPAGHGAPSHGTAHH
jgi:hypothetical protein